MINRYKLNYFHVSSINYTMTVKLNLPCKATEGKGLSQSPYTVSVTQKAQTQTLYTLKVKHSYQLEIVASSKAITQNDLENDYAHLFTRTQINDELLTQTMFSFYL